jgi:hypothetical protein
MFQTEFCRNDPRISEGEPEVYFAFASDLGWPPGKFATAIKIGGIPIPFDHVDRSGDIDAFIYIRRENGETKTTMTVAND